MLVAKYPGFQVAMLSTLFLHACSTTERFEIAGCEFEVPERYVESIVDNTDGKIDDRLDQSFEVTISISAEELSQYLMADGNGNWGVSGGAANGLLILLSEASSVDKNEIHSTPSRQFQWWHELSEWDASASAYRIYRNETKQSWELVDEIPADSENGATLIAHKEAIADCHETPFNPSGNFDCLRGYQVAGIHVSYRLAQQNIKNWVEVDRLIFDRLNQWKDASAEGGAAQGCQLF